MKHSYYLDYYYDYGNYISFNDFYSNEYLIQYLIPKKVKTNNKNYENSFYDESYYNFGINKNSSFDNYTNILNLIKNRNFLYDNESNKINKILIELSVPKFTKKTEIDFIPALSKLGLGKLFNNNFSTTENPFITEKNIKYYMNNIFQKNKIELNEDGITIKSTSYGSLCLSTICWAYRAYNKIKSTFCFYYQR